ncbi:helix-turn-helix transcriptional regulator [Candidatus Galacturonibacter soehngenii]|uniref:YafY family transcriptional regulator n=1 Tax=Candidatus Galacturonatibacter soehngenii TaxID=2307010 RepID=A0A7V7QM44_9FIRM|nr:YafY family protein [Candidatus Galacturonibacter soehngenii]KAB1439707.1 YafY family transcriptional regulator [Candidatus Galacturonibacter soehngenii]
MKIDRLIGILTILLQIDKITISQLAIRFEVSSRTIQRDIDTLCKAGIPIISTQGYQGGLTIADGYKIDKTILTEKELQVILTGIKSIDSVSKTQYRQTFIDKFTHGKDSLLVDQDRILIDLASWNQDRLKEKIEEIKHAIQEKEKIAFLYYSDKGETKREIEPYLIVFKWSSWYVYGYCLMSNGFRLFKLNRLSKLHNMKILFVPRQITDENLKFEHFFLKEEIQLSALFDESVKYRLIEAYGPMCYSISKTGKLFFERGFTNPNYLVQWILSFGDKVKVINPPWLISHIKEHAKNILKQYEE